jgi:hypothetical protein
MILLHETSSKGKREDSLAFSCVLLKIFAYKNITAKGPKQKIPDPPCRQKTVNVV